ncbi:MAG: cysteine desulfurase [Mycoplasmoidaceae bacterium]
MKNLKKDFPWFEANEGLTYLDSGATSLKPQCVIDFVNKYMIKESYNSHNTDSKYTYSTTKVIYETKEKLANYLGTKSENIIFTPGATYSLNMVSQGIKHMLNEGDEILLNTLEHASNLLPWFELAKEKKLNIKYIETKDLFLTEEEIINSISKKTRLISFANGTNLIGAWLDAERISIKIKEKNPNTIICVDGTQYVPLNNMKLNNSKIDFLACSGHKMCAPTGIGLLYLSDEIKENFRPTIYGGGMNKSITKDSYLQMNNLEKYEAGTLNILGIYGWNAAIDYLNNLDFKEIKNNLIEIKKYLDKEINKIPGFSVINDNVNSYITIFKHETLFSQDLAGYLGQNGIIVRSGFSCAKLAHYNTKYDQFVRVSLYIYSDYDDVNKLIAILKKYKKGDEINWV